MTILDWAAEWPALLTAIAVLYLPGLAMVASLRVRGLALWALAPVASTALIAALAILLALVGIPWTALTVLIGVVIALAVVFCAALALGPRRAVAAPRPRNAFLPVALAVGILLGALRLGAYIGDPDAISQTNDAVFHLNALRFVIETVTASSLDLTGLLDSSSFYPAAWHGVASLVVLISGASIPVVANMVALVVAAVAWPIGITWLTAVITRSQSTAALAAVLSPALLSFPLLMLEWGVLYPYALALALLPAVIAVTIVAPRWISGDGPVVGVTRNAVVAGVAVLAGIAALALAQPAAVLAWALCAMVWFTWWMAERLREARSRLSGAIVLVIAWAIFAALWFVLTRAIGSGHWGPFSGKVDAVVDVLLLSPVLLPAAPLTAVLVVAGLIVAIRRHELRWLATTWLILAGMYVVAASIGQPLLRHVLVGGWYADPYRIGAMLPLVAIPLAAIGVSAIARWAARAIGGDTGARARAIGEWTALAALGLIQVVALVVVPVVQMPRIIEGVPDDESRYHSDERSYLSPDERALLTDLAEHVPTGARIIGNPSTGTGFGYLLSGADVFPRTWSAPRTEEWAVLADRMHDAATDPLVCDALAAYGDPDFVLDFGPGEQSPGRFLMPGMTGFAEHDGFELVDERGDASLWRITACR